MPILNLKKIKSAKELEAIARHDLEGKTLQQIMASITATDSSTRVSTKAGVGMLLKKDILVLVKIILLVLT